MAGKEYRFGSWYFPTQTALEQEIKNILKSVAMNQTFQQPLLEAVVNTLHPAVVHAGQRVVRFEYLSADEQSRRGLSTAGEFRGGKLMMGFFEPLGEWRDVTVYPWRKASNHQELKQAFRKIIAEYLPRPQSHHRCTMPGCGAEWRTLEYQHVAPTFNEIAKVCLELCTAEEVESLFGYSKFSAGADIYSVADVISATHPAVRYLIKAHQTNQWGWLCPEHHRGVQAGGAQLRLATAAA